MNLAYEVKSIYLLCFVYVRMLCILNILSALCTARTSGQAQILVRDTGCMNILQNNSRYIFVTFSCEIRTNFSQCSVLSIYYRVYFVHLMYLVCIS